jgi:diguanylate cyclase (GGDEF)-like protein
MEQAMDQRNEPGGIGITSDFKALSEKLNLLESVVENFPGGLLLFDKNLLLAFCNRRQREMLGYPDWFFGPCPPSISEIFWFNAKRGEYGLGDPLELVEHRMGLVAKREEHVFERRRPNGTLLEIRGKPLEGGGFVSTYLDITEQREGQEAIRYLASHDILTNLPNRYSATENLKHRLSILGRRDSIAILFVDLDGFKPINDKYGHTCGDEILKAVALRLARSTRENDHVSRYGGDEFLILLNCGSGQIEAEVLAERIKRRLAEPFVVGEHRLCVGATVGIAVCPEDGNTVEDLVNVADHRMLTAKRTKPRPRQSEADPQVD